MRRWQVALYACDGSRAGTLSQHWTRRGAARRRRIEEADDRRLSQLIGSRWVVERIDSSRTLTEKDLRDCFERGNGYPLPEQADGSGGAGTMEP